jgi:hypothetical protein
MAIPGMYVRTFCSHVGFPPTTNPRIRVRDDGINASHILNQKTPRNKIYAYCLALANKADYRLGRQVTEASTKSCLVAVNWRIAR